MNKNEKFKVDGIEIYCSPLVDSRVLKDPNGYKSLWNKGFVYKNWVGSQLLVTLCYSEYPYIICTLVISTDNKTSL